jgi:predicted metal-binding protein
MTRKILDKVPPEILQADLERYRQKAVELGAAEAKIITTDMIIVDERVRAKCSNPKCRYYGTNGDCPPHGPDLETVRKIVNKYQYAIFTFAKLASDIFAEISNDRPWNTCRLKNHEMISKVEAAAFYDGYYLATGLADGPCKSLYCADLECAVLKGQGCRKGLRARHSMESWGMDCYSMATRVGWDIYPIGKDTRKEDIPHGAGLGLVLIY